MADIHASYLFSQPTEPPSYGTIPPYFVIDTEYLKTLTAPSGELVESASLPNARGSYFPSVLSANQAEDSTSESGLFSPDDDPSASGISTTLNSSYFSKPGFFQECEIQITKLFHFMEFHLSKIERAVETVVHDENKKSIHNPSHRDHPHHQDKQSDDPDHPERKSDDSGVCDDERTQLVVSLDDKDEDEDKATVNLLTRLREGLVRIQDVLSSSFADLDMLVDMYDHNHDNKKGRTYLEKKSSRRKDFERRMDDCLESLDYERNKLYRKQALKIDSHGRARIRTESEITMSIRKSSTSCVTYFHALLFLVTLGLIAYMYFHDQADNRITWTVYLRLLRGPFLILLFLYLYGVNMKAWADNHIDYVTIFRHPPKSTPTPDYVFKVAGLFCVFFTVLVVALLVSFPFTDEVPGKIVPLIMWSSLILFVVNPFNIFLRRERLSFVTVCVRILLAPFTFVYFGDFWLADQLNSSVAILLDIQYLICYMISDTWYGDVNTGVCTSSDNGIRPVISCLPALWRLLQCLRCFYDTGQIKHLANGLKYFTTFPVVLFAAMFSTKVQPPFRFAKLDPDDVGWIFSLWILSLLIHAIYTFIWDVYCDWGLWDFSKRTYFRKTLVFKYKIIYLFAILLDFVLRFAWVFKLSLGILWDVSTDFPYTILVIAEILRRFMWNFFRIEYAHVLERENED